MTWTKLGDSFNDREDLLAVSRSSRLLYVEALVYSNRMGTDGAISRGSLRRFSDHPDPTAAAAELVAGLLWLDVGDEGWMVADFLAEQLSKERLDQRAADAKARKDRWTASRKNASQDTFGTRSERNHGTVPRPDPNPTRPEGLRVGFRKCAHGKPFADDGSACELCPPSAASA